MNTSQEEAKSYQTLKCCDMEGFLVILVLGNVNNLAFSLKGISSFGFNDWQTGFPLTD